MPVRATKRGDGAHPLAARLRRARVRRELRRAGGRARARRHGRARAGDRPLRDRRAPDLGLRDAHVLAAGARPDGLAAPELRRARRAHAVSHLALAAAVVVLDVRLPRAVRAAVEPGGHARALEFETATVTGRDGHTVHTDRGELRAPLIVDALGWRRVLSNGTADPAARTRGSRAAWRCTRRAAARRWSCGSTPATCAPATRWSFPAGDELRVGVGSFWPTHHVKEPTVRLAQRPGPAGRGLPGQLDPPPAAPGRRGRRLLRRRLRRALPAADRRGHPHGALLRARLRARAARGARRAPHPRAGAAPATAPSPTRTRASSAGCSACQRAVGQITPSRAVTAPCRAFENRRI